MVKSKIPPGIEREHVLGAIGDFQQGVPHEFGESTKFDVVHEGMRFPPKAIVGLAARRATGQILTPKDFSGGEESACFRLLHRLGFTVEPKAATAWHLKPGDIIKRTTLHGLYGGRQQGGIAPSSTSPNILLFTDAKSGEQWGYFDGWQADGRFYYTGEGQKGDMQMVQGNKAILAHRSDGRAIRLFEGARGEVVYRGEFVLDEAEPYHRAEGPERDSALLREVFVFHLVPVDQGASLRRSQVPKSAAPTGVVEVEPEAATAESFDVRPSSEPRESDRRESRLVADFRAQCEIDGRRLVRHKISPPGEQPLFTDLFDKGGNLLIEAKGSVTRESIRMAIGQLLDYRRFLRPAPKLAILTPTRPRDDLVELLHGLEISVVFREGSGFREE